MGASSKITRLWNTACYRVGIAVAKNPIPTIVFCVLLTALATAKVALTEQVSAIDGYAMDDARSREEFSTFQQFLDSDGPGITLGILVKATDGGSLLREKYLKETVELADFVSTNFKLNTSGVMRNFNEFCHGFCQANEPVVQYYNGIQLLGANKTDGISQRIDLSYPTSSFFGREFSLIPNFFGIELEADGKTLKSSTLILLYFRAERHRDWTTKMVKGWELDVRDHFASYQSSLLTVDVMSQTVVESEIVRAGMSLQPFLVVGFVIMAIFCALTTMASAVFLYSQKPSWNKVALAIIACLNPFMACGTAFGAVFALGVTFSPILCITPFLVLAISVDDSFLMLHAWNRLEASRKVPLDRKTRQNHMAEVLVETGPAITISALTNILVFGVGAMTSPSEIRIFCYGNAAAIFMDMVYQATFYTAVMTLLADEKEQTTNEKICRIQDQMKEFVTKFLRSYIDFISNTFVSAAIVALWLIFIAFAVFGLTHLSVKLNPGKFFMKDSPMIRMDHMRTNDVVPYYTPVTVVINNPGDLSNDTVLEGLNNLKRRFESLPNSIGPNSTKFFLSDFIAFRESVDEESEMVEDDEKTDIEKFLEWPEYSFWRGFMNIDNKTKTVSKFMFSTGYHGEQLKDWSQRGKLLNEWRAAVDEFKEPFNASVFTEDAFFLDMIEMIPAITWQSTLATFVCVSAVCFLFIADLFTVLIVSTSILVTCIGVFGYLALFGVSLDPVIMSIAIMCIGFSVDIPAHVSFHFYAAKAKTAQRRSAPAQISAIDLVDSNKTISMEPEMSFRECLSSTLTSVGFPVIQAGVSTDFCALPLAFLDLYMARMFAAALTLCVSLSLLHGLVIIPALLSVYYKLKAVITSRNRK